MRGIRHFWTERENISPLLLSELVGWNSRFSRLGWADVDWAWCLGQGWSVGKIWKQYTTYACEAHREVLACRSYHLLGKSKRNFSLSIRRWFMTVLTLRVVLVGTPFFWKSTNLLEKWISFVIYYTVKHVSRFSVTILSTKAHISKKNLLFEVITTPFHIHLSFLQWEFNFSCTASRSSICTTNDNIQNRFIANLLWRGLKITL